MRLALRPLTAVDVTGPWLTWINDPEVTRFLFAGARTWTADDLRDWLRRFDWIAHCAFAIEERDGAHIGNVTLNNIDPATGTADTGLMIGEKDRWGRGYAREAWTLLLEYAFTARKLRRVIATVVDGNDASLAVLRHLGFRLEATGKQEVRWADGYRDLHWLAILADEFRA